MEIRSRKIRFVSLCLALLMLLNMMPITVFADAQVNDGISIEKLNIGDSISPGTVLNFEFNSDYSITYSYITNSGEIMDSDITGNAASMSIEPPVQGASSLTVTSIDVKEGTGSTPQQVNLSFIVVQPVKLNGTAEKTYDGTVTADPKDVNLIGTSEESTLTISASKIYKITKAEYDNADAGKNKTVTVTAELKTEGLSADIQRVEDYLSLPASLTFLGTINPKPITANDVNLNQDSFEYTGDQKTVQVSVTDENKILTADIDFSMTGNTGTDASDGYKVTVTGQNNYTGIVEKPWKINPKPITSDNITLDLDSFEYTGDQKTVRVSVTDGNKTLTEGIDYTFHGNTGTDVSEDYKVIVIGQNNYTGTAEKPWKITEKQFDPDDPNQEYTITWVYGEGDTPTTKVKKGEMPVAPKEAVKDGYQFTGWSPEIVAAAADATYKAIYKDKSDVSYLQVKFTHIKDDGSYGAPEDIEALDLALSFTLSLNGNIYKSLNPISLSITPGKDIRPILAIPFDSELDISHSNPNDDYKVTVIPAETKVRSNIYSSESPENVPEYTVMINNPRFTNPDDVNIQLDLDVRWIGSGKAANIVDANPIPGYGLPEDEIGAYKLNPDGTKEYLIFHTYEICLYYLGNVELCSGYERCFHK